MQKPERLSEVDGGRFSEHDLVLHNHFEAMASKWPDEVAVVSCRQRSDFSCLDSDANDSEDCLRWTYKYLWERSEHLAGTLLKCGVATDRRMVVILRNQAEWPLLLWTSLRLGMTFVPLGPGSTESPTELRHQLTMAEAGIVIAADRRTAMALDRLTPELMSCISLKVIAGDAGNIDGWVSLVHLMEGSAKLAPLPHVQRSQDDVTMLYFTSGTTSLPKATPCKSSNVVRAMFGYANSWCMDTTRRIVAQSPSFHSYTGNGWFAFWLRGGCVVYPSPSYDPAATLKAIERERCTDMMGNPSMIASLVNHMTAGERDLSSLFHMNLSGSLVTPRDLRSCYAPPLNARTVDASFGSTETATISNWPLHERQPIYGDTVSVGKLIPGIKARVCYPDTRKLTQFGEAGELHVGCNYFYKNWPGRDESTFYREGDVVWIVTGDQAYFGDCNELYIIGRYKDLIIRGGRNISPTAIEAVVNSLPGTTSVVVGIPDDVAGEVPAIVVKYNSGFSQSCSKIRETVVKVLGKHASPQKMIRVEDLGVDQFPITAAGKPDKRRLRAMVINHLASSVQAESLSRNILNDYPNTVTCRGLLGIWSDLTLQQSEDIDIDEPVTTFADSLLMLQATSLIKKRLKRSINAEQILLHPTIRQLAQLIDSQTDLCSSSLQIDLERLGPPSAADIAHARSRETVFAQTKSIVERKLSKYDLDWNDVESVMPYYDNARFMLSSARRLQSWNDRHVLIADGNVSQVRTSLSQSLERHPLFRSIPMKYNDDTWLHVVMRNTLRTLRHVVEMSDEPISVDELHRYRLNDTVFDHASRSGFAFKACILPIDDGSSSGVIINMNHSTYDAISTSLWLDDLVLCLAGKGDEMQARVPYKHFADAYWFGRQSSAAQRNTRYFVKNLLWYVTEQKAWWPKQRQRDWFMGEPVGLYAEEDEQSQTVFRQSIDSPTERCGSIGFTTIVEGSDGIHQSHGISAAAVFKTAVAIFNVHQTKARFAVFSSWEAARSFPFLEDNPAYTSMLPDPMDIAGPTGQRVINRIPVKPTQTVLELLSEVQEEMREISRHAHAPLYEIRDKLAAVSSTEADAFIDALHRQIFNWVPNIRVGNAMDTNSDSASSKPLLRRLHRVARGDCGFAWTGCRISKNTVSFSVWWDDAQLSWSEAKDALAEVVACAKWMMTSDNWDKRVSQWWEESCEDWTRAVDTGITLSNTS